jgi:hypothetical protein
MPEYDACLERVILKMTRVVIGKNDSDRMLLHLTRVVSGKNE